VTRREVDVTSLGTVVCIGGANMDRKAYVDNLRLGTSTPVSFVKFPGGVARNVAENLSQLGVAISLFTCVGDDVEGKHLLSRCEKKNIDVSPSRALMGYSTGSFTTILKPDGEMHLGLADMGIYDAVTVQLLEERRPLFDGAAFVFADTNFPSGVLEWLVKNAREYGWKLIFDAVSIEKARKLPEDLKGIHCLLCNQLEASAICFAQGEDTASLDDLSKALLEKGVERFVITLGKEGIYCREGTEARKLAPFEARVVDVTGAGDAFIAGTIYGFLRGLAISDAARYGLRAAKVTLETNLSVSDKMNSQVLEQDGEM
jgi:pseudouridine kinase